MRLGSSFGHRHSTTVLVGTVAITLAAGAVGATGAVAGTQAKGKAVSYLGLNFTVPASWPVIDISATSTTCVRFDQHVVYLGTPGTNQNCPASVIGSTEALLVRPATTRTTTTTATDNTVSHQITVNTPSASITVSYRDDRATVAGMLAGAGLPMPVPATPVAPRHTGVKAHAITTTVPADATNFTGRGFDACTAPSESTMNTWKTASPYSAVGIYIGGPDMGCPAQPNLTPSWVTDQYHNGWRFLPIYVGLQALSNQITSAQSQGTASADDAVAHAQALGFAPGNVLYDDMEGYPAQYRGEALAFEAAWTAELHNQGYFSGVYSSQYSGITDLVSEAGGLPTPDVVWSAAWNNHADTAYADTGIPNGLWVDHQRAHQYASPNSGETYGGVHINTDDNYLDVGIAGSTVPVLKSAYQPVSPYRVLDTRNGVGAVGGNSTISVPISGLPGNVTAVVLNVTAISPTSYGYLSVFADGEPIPTTSSLNLTPNQTIANLVTMPVYDGSVDFYNHVGSVQLLADLFGYYTTAPGNQYHQVTPARLLDTRNGTGVPAGALGDNASLNLTVGGLDGIPSNVTAVIMNLTAANPTDDSYLTAYAGGAGLPSVSNLNFTPGTTVPNLAIVPVANGMVTIHNHVGTVDVLGDVLGYFIAGSSLQFTPTPPVRLLDTRYGTGTGGSRASIGPDGVVRLAVAGNAGVPSGVEAVVLNVTAIQATNTSFLTVYPDGQNRPEVSNLNYTNGETIANQVIVPVVDGYIDFYNHVGSVDVAADIAGYFTG